MDKLIYAQWLKTKRTPVRMLVIICPVALAMLFGLYIAISNSLQGREMLAFFLLLSICAGFALSFFVPMVYDPDKNASLFANELRIGVKRSRLFLSKFLLISILLGLIEIIATVIFVMFLSFFNPVEIDLSQLLMFIAISFFTLLPMIAVYQFLALRFGYVGSILTGSFVTLSSILLGTTDLGINIWKKLPFTWNVRLIYGSSKISELSAYTGWSMKLGQSLLLTIVLLCLFILWYNRWDGAGTMEE